jgi:hypothetical protein
MERRMKLATEMSEQNGGKLPNPQKMIQQGHGGLYRYIQRHPKEFGHFAVEEAVGRENNGNFNVGIRNEHLTAARKLIKEHGMLPDATWLARRGYTRLASYMKIYPDVFVGLENE